MVDFFELKFYILREQLLRLMVKKMKATKAISRMVIAVIVIVIIVIAGVVGYYLTMPARLKDTLIMGTTDSVQSRLDPASAYDFFGEEIIQSLGSGLVEYRAGATGSIDDIVPSLATNWTVSADGLQWTFSLRKGVHFDDGTEFNATHVKYSFDRGIGLADPDGPFVGIGYSDIINNVTVVDKYTVVFNLKIPFAPFLSLMAFQGSYIVDPAYAPMSSVINYTDGNPRASNTMGLGPYTLLNWTRVGGKDYEMRLQANPNYWNASGGYPKTKNIIIKFYGDSTGLALAIKASAVDIAFRQLAAADIRDMETNTNLHVWPGTGAFIQYLVFQEIRSPFNDTRIRQAVGAAINRTTLAQTVFLGQAQNLYSIIPIGMSGHNDVFQSLGDPNYTRTTQLLSEVGYNSTHKLTFDLWYETTGHYPQSAQQAQVLKQSLEASGVISVNLKSAEWSTYRANTRQASMDASIYGWYPDYIDPDDYIFPFLDSTGNSWLNPHYSNPQMDQLIAWARGNTSSTARNNLYSQIQNLMVTDCPLVPLYQGSAYAVTTLNVKGVYLDITQNWRNWLLYATQ